MNTKTEKLLEKIAAQNTPYKTLKRQNSSEDFKEMSTWELRKALLEAYKAGLEAAATNEKLIED